MDAEQSAMAQSAAIIALAGDGYAGWGRGVVIQEARHQRTVRYLAAESFLAEVRERFNASPDTDEHTRRLNELIATYDPATQAIVVTYDADGGFSSYLIAAPADAVQAAPVPFRADASIGYQELIDQVPALAEANAIETLAAIGWRGYQKHGRGIVVYLPTYGELRFDPIREHLAITEKLRSRNFANVGVATDVALTGAAQQYDPFAEFLFATMVHLPDGKGEWIYTRLNAPKTPSLCRARWHPAPRGKTA